jgi:hypothetical protein
MDQQLLAMDYGLLTMDQQNLTMVYGPSTMDLLPWTIDFPCNIRRISQYYKYFKWNNKTSHRGLKIKKAACAIQAAFLSFGGFT